MLFRAGGKLNGAWHIKLVESVNLEVKWGLAHWAAPVNVHTPLTDEEGTEEFLRPGGKSKLLPRAVTGILSPCPGAV